MQNTQKKHIKNFTDWNTQKQHIETHWKHKRVKAGQVWWSKLGVNVCREQDGGKDFRRPVVILKRINYMLALVIPLTSQVKNPTSPFYFRLKSDDKNSICLLLQIRVISTKRLVREKWTLPREELVKLIGAVTKFFFSNHV